MIFLYRFLELLIKIAILFFIVSFERVIGFPIVFFTILISFLLISKSIYRYIIFIVSAFLLAVFYQIAFVLSFVLITTFYLGFVLGGQLIESNLKRFLLLLSLVIFVIYFASSIKINLMVIANIIFGYIISMVFLLKFLFLRYGFLGNKMNSRHSFFK